MVQRLDCNSKWKSATADVKPLKDAFMLELVTGQPNPAWCAERLKVPCRRAAHHAAGIPSVAHSGSTSFQGSRSVEAPGGLDRVP